MGRQATRHPPSRAVMTSNGCDLMYRVSRGACWTFDEGRLGERSVEPQRSWRMRPARKVRVAATRQDPAPRPPPLQHRIRRGLGALLPSSVDT